MKNLIPHFIAEKFKENSFRGRFLAATLFMDISGFTSMTSILMRKGKEGAEVLSDLLNQVFIPVVQAVYREGGFISVFAGDALTAIFPVYQSSLEELLSPLLAASAIRNVFLEQGAYETKYGVFALSVKIGLSFGQVDWGILGSEDPYMYFFRGEAIDDCAASEHHSKQMEIILHEKLYLKVKERIEVDSQGDRFYLLKRLSLQEFSLMPRCPLEDNEHIDRKVLSAFLPKEIIEHQVTGEFRHVVSVYISFKVSENSLSSLVDYVKYRAKIYGGHFNKIDFGDKGNTMLIFFGAPVSFENDMERAMLFIWSAKELLGDTMRAGITAGIAYFGLIGSNRRAEYTCIGDVVNLSARFMMKAMFNQIWVSKEMKEKTQDTFVLEDIGLMRLKGFEEPIQVFSLKGKKSAHKERHFAGKMIGRSEELDLLSSYCQESILQEKFGGVVYVYGEAGIGKSRLVSEFLESLPIKICALQTDSILRQSLNPFTYFLKDYFQQHQEASTEQRKGIFHEKLQSLLDALENLPESALPEIQELKRTPSFLGAMMGLYWEGSLYEELDAKGRHENTFFALKNFFKALSKLQPTALFLEDLHWIDPDSKDLLKLITRNIDAYPLLIIATSRLNDDGTKPRLSLEGILEREILVESLPLDVVFGFIEDQLGQQCKEDLLTMIKDRSLGNPFYIEQICLYLKEKNLILQQDGFFTLDRDFDSLPNGIHGIIIARIDRLSQEIKNLIQIASILGREFDLTILFALIHSIQEYLQEDFQRSVQKAEEEQLWTALSELKYIFKHALLRDAVYEMQLRKTLRMLHCFAAKTMEKIYKEEEHFNKIAYHYDKAEEIEKSIYFYEKASDFSQKNYKNKETLEYYSRLLEIVTDTKKTIAIQYRQAKVLHLIGSWDKASEVLQKNIGLAKELGDNHLLAQNKTLLSRIACEKGDYSKSLQLLEEAKEIALSLHDLSLYGQIINRIGVLYFYKEEYSRAMEYYEENKNISLEVGDKSSYTKAVRNMGIVHSIQGAFDKAMECFQESKEINQEIGDRVQYSYVVSNIAGLYFLQGDYLKAREHCEESRLLSRELGDRRGYSSMMANLGNIYSDQGSFKEAIECFQESRHISLELGAKILYLPSIGNLGKIYAQKGDFTQSIKFFDEAIELGRSLDAKSYLCDYLYGRANTLLELGKKTQAQRSNEESIALAREIGRFDILFKATLLKHQYNKDTISLRKMLSNEGRSAEERAALHYALGQLTGCRKESQKAAQIYKSLYQKTPKYEYKKRMS